MIRPLDELSRDGIRSVFTDIDDTLTYAEADLHGLVPEAYAGIVRLKNAGFRIVPVTGRPAGWAEVLAATWPVDAVIAENGAIAIVPEARPGRRPSLRRIFFDGGAPDRARLDAIRDEVLARIRNALVAGDQWLRICDLAFDIGETQSLPDRDVDAIAEIVESHGASHTRSTVHLHASFGDHDKARMLVKLSRELWNDAEPETSAIFVGDSPNDQAGFAYFPRSVGVANVRKFEAVLKPAPAFVTSLPGGRGFAELAAHLLPRE